MDPMSPEEQHAYLIKLAQARMPFGKYKGTFLVDLPLFYLNWFSQKGFPAGKLGEQLQMLYDIKLNGDASFLQKLKKIANDPRRYS